MVLVLPSASLAGLQARPQGLTVREVWCPSLAAGGQLGSLGSLPAALGSGLLGCASPSAEAQSRDTDPVLSPCPRRITQSAASWAKPQRTSVRVGRWWRRQHSVRAPSRWEEQLWPPRISLP